MTPAELRIALERARTSTNVHTVNKCIMYLDMTAKKNWLFDKEKSNEIQCLLLAEGEKAVNSGDFRELKQIMLRWI